MSVLKKSGRASLACLTAIAAMATAASAQGWPQRHVTMVVPFAAGSSSDAVGRVLGARISEILGQQIIIENVGGAGGMVGTARVARATPDGYQFVLGSTDTLAQNQTIYKNPQYNAATDFAHVAMVGDVALLLVVRKDLPANDLKELTAHAKANFAKMQFGSSGLGSSSHLTCSQLTQMIGANVAHVPYRGSGPALQDMIGGQIDYFCSLAPSAMPSIENKLIRAIAVLTAERSPFMPDLMTAKEQGFPGIDASTWFAASFPKGTPADIVEKLNKAISDSLDTPTVKQRLGNLALLPATAARRTSDYAQKYISEEIERWATVIKASGVKLD